MLRGWLALLGLGCAQIGCGEGGVGGGDIGVPGVVGAGVSTTSGGFVAECTALPPFAEPTVVDGDTVGIDFDVRCRGETTGEAGVGIAMSETQTHLVSSGRGGPYVNLTPGLRSFAPFSYDGTQVVATSSDALGIVAIAGVHAVAEGPWVDAFRGLGFPSDPVTVTDQLEDVPTMLALDVSSYDGALRAWFTTTADPTAIQEATTQWGASGPPTFALREMPGEPGKVRVAVGPEERLVVFNATTTPGELLALVDDEMHVVRAGGPHDASDYQVADATADATAVYLVSILDDRGLHVAQADAPELALAATAPWRPSCAAAAIPVPAGGCPTTQCHEQATGVMARGHAIARLGDDAAAIVFVEQRADYQVALAVSADGTRCEPAIVDDDSRFDLVVLRVDLRSGLAAERLRAPVGRFPDPGEGVGDAIDVAAVANQIGIAVRGEDGKGWKVRAMRFSLGPG